MIREGLINRYVREVNPISVLTVLGQASDHVYGRKESLLRWGLVGVGATAGHCEGRSLVGS